MQVVVYIQNCGHVFLANGSYVLQKPTILICQLFSRSDAHYHILYSGAPSICRSTIQFLTSPGANLKVGFCPSHV